MLLQACVLLSSPTPPRYFRPSLGADHRQLPPNGVGQLVATRHTRRDQGPGALNGCDRVPTARAPPGPNPDLQLTRCLLFPVCCVQPPPRSPSSSTAPLDRYIGTHTVVEMLTEGMVPVVLDNLVNAKKGGSPNVALHYAARMRCAVLRCPALCVSSSILTLRPEPTDRVAQARGGNYRQASQVRRDRPP